MRNLGTLMVSALCASLLAGCGTFGQSVDFKPSPLGGVSDQQLKAVYFDPAGIKGDPELINDAELQKILKAQCQPPGPQPALGAAVVPIIAALGQLAVSQYFVQHQRRIEQIVEDAKAAYSLTFDIDPAALSQTRCLVLVRHGSKPDGSIGSIGLQAVIQLDAVQAGPTGTAAVKFRPIYVRAANAVAQTRQADKPAMSVSIGLSIKAVSPQRADGVARLLPTGEGAVGVANVVLSADAAQVKCVEPVCKSSELLPYPFNRGRLSVTLAVAEQGQTGFNDKVVLADLAALKEALGPAVGEAIKAKFGD